MSNTHIVLVLAASTFLLAYKLCKGGKTYGPNLPPSPKSCPVIGNLFSVPAEHEHLGFMRLGEEASGESQADSTRIHHNLRQSFPFRLTHHFFKQLEKPANRSAIIPPILVLRSPPLALLMWPWRSHLP
ncbi:hypothetical protein AG1IA_02928 [Rhizoctonia solani AG-1 IA]|uniref:Cytochrome P450 domain-containing protein n=1 Tax=Thanatephorus cucumeris (strain AG1-IA) TaxID=983506 RepID=L8WY72_THACA|nr:hypothetical protein AG1IA_02928 [Rhizoctonia solani AG-1 IA]